MFGVAGETWKVAHTSYNDAARWPAPSRGKFPLRDPNRWLAPPANFGRPAGAGISLELVKSLEEECGHDIAEISVVMSSSVGEILAGKEMTVTG